MMTLIRLLLEEQSDLGLHCLPGPICAKTLDYGALKTFVNCFAFCDIISVIAIIVQVFRQHRLEKTV